MDDIKIYREIKDRIDKKEKQLLDSYRKDVADFLVAAGSYYIGGIETYSHAIEIRNYLAKTGNTPSRYFRDNLDLYKDWISDKLLEDFYYAVDNVIYWQTEEGIDRRTLRCAAYEDNICKIAKVIDAFHDSSQFDKDALSLLKKELSREEDLYIFYGNRSYGINGYNIAARIDRGDEEFVKYIEDQIFLDGGEVSYEIIRGIMMSKSTRLYETLGKLLIAARLQEGTRQAICECMDCGREEAFLYFFKLLLDNDLFRFSSVVRAGITWTGIMNEEWVKTDRVSKKMFDLCYTYLTDSDVRRQALLDEDAMKIYLSLWATGCHDGRDSAELAKDLFEHGTSHQRLIALFYLIETDVHEAPIADAVILHADEPQLMAFAIPRLRSSASRLIRDAVDNIYAYVRETNRAEFSKVKRDPLKKADFISDEENCRVLYERLLYIYSNMTTKKKEFSHVIFPWLSATLQKSDVLVLLAYISGYLMDDALIDKTLAYLPEIDTDSRGAVFALLAANPSTDVQRKTVFDMITSPEHTTRATAFHILNELDLNADDYLVIEDSLRFKKADMRNRALSFLYDLKDNELMDTIERLYSAKSEEKRLGGLSLIMMLKKDKDRQAEYENVLKTLDFSTAQTDHEQTLINEILEGTDNNNNDKEQEPLFDQAASYEPVIDTAWVSERKKTFVKVFPDSGVGALSLLSKEKKKLIQLLKELDDIIEKNKDYEYIDENGNAKLLRNSRNIYIQENNETKAVLADVWNEFYEKNLQSDYLTVIKLIMLATPADETPGFEEFFKKIISKLFGEYYSEHVKLKHEHLVNAVFSHLDREHTDRTLLSELKAYIYAWLLTECKNPLSYHYTYVNTWSRKEEAAHRSILSHGIFSVFDMPYYDEEAFFDKLFPIRYGLVLKAEVHGERIEHTYWNPYRLKEPIIQDYLRAYQLGIISKGFLEKMLWNEKKIQSSVRILSDYVRKIREKGKSVAQRGYRYYGNDPEHQLFYKDNEKYKDRNKELSEIVDSCYNKISSLIVESELKRGDLPTEYSIACSDISRIYGVSYFVRILSALGKQKFARNAYYCYYSNNAPSRVACLCHLLAVCIPGENDNAETLKAALAGKKISDKRLVEAALYAPEWISIIGEYLGWEGFLSCCYYFMAHMNEWFDDKRTAMIAKFTPFKTSELKAGAFDCNWFRDVYDCVGEERFKIIYDAAKYISDGAKHTRARKYADAALGNLDISEVIDEVEAKRNKDYLMCLGAIPSKKEADIKERYLFIRKFEKESKKFGAQRRASEKIVSEMAIKNMAMANGYQDEMRFILSMESKVSEGLIDFFKPVKVDDIEAFLELDKNNKPTVVCNKDGKKLKSIPAKYKKNDYILELQEAKKTLTTQGQRSKVMFEEAMEEESVFTFGELRNLSKSPVIGPVIKSLVLKAGNDFGFIDDFTKQKDSKEVLIAHPWHLYKAGVWRDYQKKIFELQLRQPFRQVFRELYVKTKDEAKALHSMRFAGNQIQPRRTLALLRTRRWIADAEDGLQKIYYKKNIIASIYAMADWFSPADIEEPTLEWVVFWDRKTFKEMRIEEVPDILFSETMRDVDLVVSVAHAGDVDPEFSHSTIEMRRAIAEFTLPLFKLTNVSFTDSHALVNGTRGNYSIHLGSGVIHQEGGAMINVLPVHSQKRGRIFLPFVDDDPKTAEVISKILLFAEDKKIKDPFILQQIKP